MTKTKLVLAVVTAAVLGALVPVYAIHRFTEKQIRQHAERGIASLEVELIKEARS